MSSYLMEHFKKCISRYEEDLGKPPTLIRVSRNILKELLESIPPHHLPTSDMDKQPVTLMGVSLMLSDNKGVMGLNLTVLTWGKVRKMFPQVFTQL